MTYNGVDYAYIYNVQGDVIALVDSTGAKVVEYYYDAWGKILSKTGTLATTLGTLNPFRYRGYVYDEETGLYYLRSRYYNPKWERFANADNIVGLSNEIYAHNLFAYCRNNPINFVDYTGHFVLPLVFFPHDISFTQVSDIEIDECFDCGFMINAGFNQGPPNGYQSYRNGHNDLYEGMMEKVRQSIQGITLRMDRLKSIVILMITIGKTMRMEKESSPMSPYRQIRNTNRHLKAEIRNQEIHLCGVMKESDGGAQESC